MDEELTQPPIPQGERTSYEAQADIEVERIREKYLCRCNDNNCAECAEREVYESSTYEYYAEREYLESMGEEFYGVGKDNPQYEIWINGGTLYN